MTLTFPHAASVFDNRANLQGKVERKRTLTRVCQPYAPQMKSVFVRQKWNVTVSQLLRLRKSTFPPTVLETRSDLLLRTDIYDSNYMQMSVVTPPTHTHITITV